MYISTVESYTGCTRNHPWRFAAYLCRMDWANGSAGLPVKLVQVGSYREVVGAAGKVV